MKYERQLNNVSQRQDLKGRCWYYYIILGSWYSGPTWPALVIQSDSQAECWSDNTKNVKRNKLSSRTASHRYLAWLGPSLVPAWSYRHSTHLATRKIEQQPTKKPTGFQPAVFSFYDSPLSSLLSPLSVVGFLSSLQCECQCGTWTGGNFSGPKYPQKSNYKYSSRPRSRGGSPSSEGAGSEITIMCRDERANTLQWSDGLITSIKPIYYTSNTTTVSTIKYLTTQLIKTFLNRYQVDTMVSVSVRDLR